MNIIHVASLGYNKANGMNVVIPQHVEAQSQYANVALYNIANVDIQLTSTASLLNRTSYPHFDIRKFPEPFCRPDLIVFHGIYIREYISIASRLCRIGIPYVVVPHGSFTEVALAQKAFKKYWAHKLFFDKMVNNAIAIQYLSEKERQNSRFKRAAFVSPNGVTMPDWNVNSKDFSEPKKMVYVGRKHIEIKGLDCLLDACEMASDTLRRENVKIELYGPDRKGSFAEIDRMIEQRSLQGIVSNLPGVFDKKKREVLKGAHVFLLTSRSEGHPVSALEALSFGVPLLATPGTGMCEEIKENECGWATELDPVRIANALCGVLDNWDKLGVYSENAQRYVSINYSWSKVARHSTDIYRQLIGEN